MNMRLELKTTTTTIQPSKEQMLSLLKKKKKAPILLNNSVHAEMSEVLCEANIDRSMYTYLSRKLKGV